VERGAATGRRGGGWRSVSSVAVDDAERDDDGHTEEDGDRQHQPAILELASHYAAQEDRTRSTVVLVGAAVASTAAPAPVRTLTAAAAAAARYDGRPLDGCHGAVETADLTGQEQPTHIRTSRKTNPRPSIADISTQHCRTVETLLRGNNKRSAAMIHSTVRFLCHL